VGVTAMRQCAGADVLQRDLTMILMRLDMRTHPLTHACGTSAPQSFAILGPLSPRFAGREGCDLDIT
jgi:hypothetical protein